MSSQIDLGLERLSLIREMQKPSTKPPPKEAANNFITFIPRRFLHGPNMMNRDVESALATSKQGHYICWPKQCFSWHQRHPGQLAQRAWNQTSYAPVHPRGTKFRVHLTASAKPVSSAVRSGNFLGYRIPASVSVKFLVTTFDQAIWWHGVPC